MKPKSEIPWRRRRTEALTKHGPQNEKLPWTKKAITWAQVIGAGLIGLIAWVLLNGVTALQNAEQLPGAIAKTRDSILSGYYDDSSWTGVWSSILEGYVDSGDVILSDVDVYLQLLTAQGMVDGTIATRKLCVALPFAMDGVLFKGSVNGKGIEGVAYDYVGGKEVQLAIVSIKRDQKDASVLTVHVSQDRLDSFPQVARIRSDPSKKPMDIKDNESPYCEPVRYPNGHTPLKERQAVRKLQYTKPPAQ
jgi:hypothetical protein